MPAKAGPQQGCRGGVPQVWWGRGGESFVICSIPTMKGRGELWRVWDMGHHVILKGEGGGV